MKVVSVEVLSEEAATSLRRLARREKREDRERAEKMTMCDLKNLFLADLSAFRERVARPQNIEESPLPPAAKDQLGKYEEPEAIALLEFARARAGRPVLVGFSNGPSKAFVDRLRQAAKVRNCTLHFSHLIRNCGLLKVHPKETPEESDDRFLKSLRVSW